MREKDVRYTAWLVGMEQVALLREKRGNGSVYWSKQLRNLGRFMRALRSDMVASGGYDGDMIDLQEQQ